LRWSCALNHPESSTNIYEQLGFPDAGAMLVKAQLVTQIAKHCRIRVSPLMCCVASAAGTVVYPKNHAYEY
jgi:hypothetical protein